MKIEMNNGKTLSVTFQYDKDPITCTCTIKDMTDVKTFNDAPVVTISKVTKSKHDQHVKFNARKYALSKALNQVNFSRTEKSIIWQQYLSTVKVPK